MYKYGLIFHRRRRLTIFLAQNTTDTLTQGVIENIEKLGSLDLSKIKMSKLIEKINKEQNVKISELIMFELKIG